MPRTFVGGLLIGLTVLQLVRPAVVAQSQDASTSPPLPPPGRLIDLGGWRVHLHCTGEARASQPTVILEAGSGDFSVDWSLVQPDVARFARVCSYDRAGAGWSDLGPRPRTMQQVVWELRTLLEKAGERPPFVLVGHSSGGWLVRVFTSTYRADVVGLVLCESGDERNLFTVKDDKRVPLVETATGQPLPTVKSTDPLRESDIPPRIRSMIEAQIKDLAPHANDPPRDKLPPDAQRMRTWSISQVRHHIVNDNPFSGEEMAALLAERTRKQHALGDMPLVVLSRGGTEREAAENPAGEEKRKANQASLATLSRMGKQVIASRSGHHIPLDEPNLVITAIRDVLAAVGK
jgi:pimeloyl-ACP methyl ester carboxylesterase